jgi:uncharacterized protein YjbI with pentapeptide repeats
LFTEISDYNTNTYTELLGIVLTVGVIEYLNRQRDKRRESERETERRQFQETLATREAEERRSLIRSVLVTLLRIATTPEMRQPTLNELDSQDLLRAISLIRADLEGARLAGANLCRAHLTLANLNRADLCEAKLHRAILIGTHLYGAELRYADLSMATLTGASLQDTRLDGANLYKAKLDKAKLQGANLVEANLREAVLPIDGFDSSTILPDGSAWTPGTDVSRFTAPDHIDGDGNADFWQPRWVKEQENNA